MSGACGGIKTGEFLKVQFKPEIIGEIRARCDDRNGLPCSWNASVGGRRRAA